MTAAGSLGRWKNRGERRNKKAQWVSLPLGEIKCKCFEIGLKVRRWETFPKPNKLTAGDLIPDWHVPISFLTGGIGDPARSRSHWRSISVS